MQYEGPPFSIFAKSGNKYNEYGRSQSCRLANESVHNVVTMDL